MGEEAAWNTAKYVGSFTSSDSGEQSVLSCGAGFYALENKVACMVEWFDA